MYRIAESFQRNITELLNSFFTDLRMNILVCHSRAKILAPPPDYFVVKLKMEKIENSNYIGGRRLVRARIMLVVRFSNGP